MMKSFTKPLKKILKQIDSRTVTAVGPGTRIEPRL